MELLCLLLAFYLFTSLDLVTFQNFSTHLSYFVSFPP